MSSFANIWKHIATVQWIMDISAHTLDVFKGTLT